MKRLYWVILCMLCACLNVEAQQSIRTTINGVNYVTLSDTSVQVAQSNVFGDIVIPEQVKIKRKFYKVVEIAPRALAANSVGAGISTIVLPNSLLRIGEAAFKGAPLTKIELPSSLVSLGQMAFYDCKELKEVVLSTSLKVIEPSTFFGCVALESIQIPTSVTEIGETAFRGSGLKSIVVPASVTKVGAGAFYDCGRIERIELPNSVSQLGVCCFQFCDKLQTLVLPDKAPRKIYPAEDIFKHLADNNAYGIKGASLMDIRGNASKSCPKYAIKDILSMTKDYAEFPYVSSPFARKNLRRIIKSFSYVAYDQVNRRMGDWQKKKEYETPEQWRTRVTVENRDKKLKEVIDDIRKGYIATYTRHDVKGSLGVYDADYGTYPVFVDGLDTVYVKVAPVEAAEFKTYWNQVVMHPKYGVIDDQLAILSCSFTLGDKTYQTANSYSNDNSNEFLANLPPMEVNLGGNNRTASDVVVDNAVDINVPTNPANRKNVFAVIIGNENYQQVTKVNYALNDAKTFAIYCNKTLGIPEPNIRSYRDATYGTMLTALDDIRGIASAYNGDLEVIFYYAGHGVPSESDKNAYLLPIDANGQHPEVCLSTKRLYETLSQLNAHRVLVFMDACFSGAQRGEGMLAAARGVALKVKADAPQGKTIVFSAASGDETAYPYKEKGHGLFTYFLLKKLQDTKGDVTLGELGDYINQEVRKQSVVINHKSQTPTVTPSEGMNDWTDMKL